MIKRKSKFKESLLVLPILLVLMCGSAFAQVTVYAEGAYTATKLKVYVYADADEALVSFGVKLTYNPAILELDESSCLTRNNDVWYFGNPSDEGTIYETPNAGPDVNSTEGSVVFVGGKLDSTEEIQTGVSAGTRILLGIVTFTNAEGVDLTTVTDTDRTVGVALGKGGAYVNFASLSGNEQDSSADIRATAEIHARGDANADGAVTGADRTTLKYYLTNGIDIIHPWIDCNDDGLITGADRACVKYILLN